MFIVYAFLIGFGIGIVVIAIYYALNPDKWEKVNEKAELEMQRKQLCKKTRRYDSYSPILGTPWHRNKVRRAIRKKREEEWFRRNFGV